MVLGQWSSGLAIGCLGSSLVAGINDINSVITEGGGLSFEHADRVTGRGPTSYEMKERMVCASQISVRFDMIELTSSAYRYQNGALLA